MPVAALIVVANIVVYFLTYSNSDLFFEYGIISEIMKENGEWYRLLTSMFIHIDIGHLFGNMIGILVFGWVLEPVIGHLRFFLMYFLGGLISALVVYFYSSPFDMTGGASGCVWCLMAGAAIIMFEIGNYNYLIYIIVNVVMQVSYTLRTENVSIPGHFGGFFGGLLLGIIIIVLIPKQKKYYLDN